MRRIETRVTVGDDGVSANIALPVRVAPGRHPAVVIIDDGAEIDDPAAWASRTYGSVTDETLVETAIHADLACIDTSCRVR